MKRIALLVTVLAIVILVWRLWPKEKKLGTRVPTRPGLAASSAITASVPPISHLSTLHSQPSPSLLLDSSYTTIAADLRLVSDLIEAFRTNFPHDGNPVGENAEITAALTGKNKLGLVLIPPEHPAINSRGELCDRWGSPFFFHQLSGTQMEIRSAGPDKKLWTNDDVTLTP